ncbi:Clp protease N-terminal domain-containing protein, partial [Streptomyces hygroscopicus]|uniref:Clp protease N-terminal domain-containing protein n=1 Tax=Streptomyces hygroscopicus TaxID=1912 RepID=UPI00369F211D
PRAAGGGRPPHPGRGSPRPPPGARPAGGGGATAPRAPPNAEVRPEHLVLGLLQEPEGLAAKAIIAQGVPLDAVRRAAVEALPPAAEEVPELVPYDAGARKVLELTYREALRLGHNYIGTEHILLALLEHEDGSGLLTGLGVDKAAAVDNIGRVLARIAEAVSGETEA